MGSWSPRNAVIVTQMLASKDFTQFWVKSNATSLRHSPVPEQHELTVPPTLLKVLRFLLNFVVAFHSRMLQGACHSNSYIYELFIAGGKCAPSEPAANLRRFWLS